LAESIASSENPLTSRVVVNRIWHHLIGRGIVKSVDNFGVLGKRPSHPELLDFLAIQFMDGGWSVKNIIRQIVLSRAYGLSSQWTDAAGDLDPDNHLLHRANVKRLSGETIRDSILSISGNANLKMYGKSVPVHLTEFMQGRGRPRRGGPIDGRGRRSIYVEVRRNFLSPMMLAFDTPIPFNTVGKRHQSNVPAQALILMNDPFVVGQAKIWSDRLLAGNIDSVENRVQTIFSQAFARPANEKELLRAVEFLEIQAEEHGLDESDLLHHARIWQDFCHAIFNMKEFIYIR
ncbi:MAG: DUF1553 domain-containing protein, partial [Planctomycetota bacterium]